MGKQRTDPRTIASVSHFAMQLVTGTVVEGKVVLSGATLPDGSIVTVLAEDSQDSVKLPAHLQAELEDALTEADREEGISVEEQFDRIKKQG